MRFSAQEAGVGRPVTRWVPSDPAPRGEGAADRRLAVVPGCLPAGIIAAALSAMIAFHAGLAVPWLFVAYSFGGGGCFVAALAITGFRHAVRRHMAQDYARYRRP